jgi:hypothetical protein
VITGVSLASIGSTEFYSFVAPSYASGTLQVTAAAAEVSMLSPQVSIYDASGTLLAQAGNPTAWSDNATAIIPAVVPGARYSVVVTGDTGTYFDAGAYQLVVSLPQSTPPSASAPAPPPVVPTPIPGQPPGNLPAPATNFSPQTATRLGRVTQTTLSNLHFNTALTVEYFEFQTSGVGTYQIEAPGASIQVLSTRGRLIAQSTGQVTARSSREGTVFYLKLRPATSASLARYNLSISLRSFLGSDHAPARQRAPRTRGFI